MKDERLEAIRREYKSWQLSGRAPAAIAVAFEDLLAEVERLEVERLTDDGVQYEHVQPNGKPVLIAENERLRGVLTNIGDQVAIWEEEWAHTFHTSTKTERLRWQFLGHLASKALQGKRP